MYPEDCLALTGIVNFQFHLNLIGLTLLPLGIMLTDFKTSQIKALVWKSHLYL